MIWNKSQIDLIIEIITKDRINLWEYSKKTPEKFGELSHKTSSKYSNISSKYKSLLRSLKIMVEEGFVKKKENKNREVIYSTIPEKIVYKKVYNFPNKIGKALLVQEKAGWIIFQV